MLRQQAGMTGEPGLAGVVGPVWSEAKVCDEVGVSRDGLAARRRAGTVLALATGDGGRVYPVFQFRRRDGRVDVDPDFVPALTTLREFDPWAVAVLLRTPAPELDDQTPVDWLRAKGAAGVVADLAVQVMREWRAGARHS